MIVYAVDLDLKARVGILAYWWQGAREVLRKSDFSPDKLLSCIRAANCRPEGRNKTTKEPQCHP